MSEKQPPKNDTDDLIDFAELYVQEGKENLTEVAHALLHGRFVKRSRKEQGVVITDEFLGHVAAMGPIESSDGSIMTEAEILKLIRTIDNTRDATMMPRTNGLRFALVLLASDERTSHADFWQTPEQRVGNAATAGFATIDAVRGYLQGVAGTAVDEQIGGQWVAEALDDIELQAASDGEVDSQGEWWQKASASGADLDRLKATITRMKLRHRAPKDLGGVGVDAVTTKITPASPASDAKQAG